MRWPSSPARPGPKVESSVLAFVVAALFVLAFARFFLLPPEGRGNVLVALIGVAPHLLLFPVIAALPASVWAKSAGYGWLVIDIASDIMALNGVATGTFLALRYGGHIAAALWIAAAAWQMGSAARVIGLLLALDLFGYSFAAPLPGVTFAVLLPTLVLLPLWFVLVGRHLTRQERNAAIRGDALGAPR